MNIVRHDPWGFRRDLLDEVGRLFERSAEASSGATADWIPAVDIEEYADRFVLFADVPGVEPSSIEITLERGVLTLSGSREQAVENSGIERRRSERASGKFLRRFVLPDTVDGDSVTASGKHGVLEVIIPKRAQAQARKITVNH
ncbi:Hsp20/alpha crystallin family protein [Sinimarinibacterium sp. CAU 1509]|uniref:Hsp20/alpha crystallin family protein n=1 Tax=Sinimarinibacterium sp. CAU 1509 TaxID=2562283 RepID=UPI0010AC341A|nr:Hsp20/alpha crystallin family protein [Sinimarinibacterium sp. CAU 1509]TJY59381.1 Hsp20/alpha crystallin family protein [Sinimarinibacterium sp. CAU 1509]